MTSPARWWMVAGIALLASVAVPQPAATQSWSFLRVAAARGDARSAITEPAAGSTLVQGNVRVRVVPPAGADLARLATVEVAWLPSPMATSTTLLRARMTVKKWRVPLAQVARGVMLPGEMTSGWNGEARVRVRTSGPHGAAWSDDVDFTLVSVPDALAVHHAD